jgi:hypothetical protein
MNRGYLDDAIDLAKDHVTSELDAAKWIGKAAVDAAKWGYKHPGEVGTGLGGLGLLVGGGPITLGLGAAAVGLGVLGARNSIRKKDWAGAVLDVAGIIPGVGGVFKGIKGVAAGGRAAVFGRDAHTAAGAAEDAVRSGAIKAGEYNPNAVKTSHLQNLSKREARQEHRLETRGRHFDQTSVGIGGVSAARNDLLPNIGLEHPPWILPPESAMLPPIRLSHAP